MAKITNLSRQGLDFVVGSKNGVAITENVPAGETRDLEIDPNSATVKGRVASGLITVATTSRQRAVKSETPAS